MGIIMGQKRSVACYKTEVMMFTKDASNKSEKRVSDFDIIDQLGITVKLPSFDIDFEGRTLRNSTRYVSPSHQRDYFYLTPS